MRNIAEYPITSNEVIEAAESAFDQLVQEPEQMIGAVAPYAMMLLLEFIREEEPALITFLNKKSKELNGKS